MRVTADEFLARVAALYDAPLTPGRKGTVAISCKSVPTARVAPKRVVASTREPNALLFRAAKYGNNHHKTKYSVVIASTAQASFHSQLSHVVKTKAERKTGSAATAAATKRNNKKAME